MKKNFLYAAPAVFFAACLIIAFVFHIFGKPILTKSDIHTHVIEFQSYDQETELLIDEFEHDKITFTYFSQQMGQIQQQVLGIFDIFENNKLESKDEDNLRKLTTLASKYAFLASRIEGANGDKQKIAKEGNKLKELDTQLHELSKTYE